MNIQQQLEHKIQSQRNELFNQQRIINQYKERDRLADLIVYCTAACRPKEGPQNVTEQHLKEYGQILRRLESYYFNFEWRKDKAAGLTFNEQCRRAKKRKDKYYDFVGSLWFTRRGYSKFRYWWRNKLKKWSHKVLGKNWTWEKRYNTVNNIMQAHKPSKWRIVLSKLLIYWTE